MLRHEAHTPRPDWQTQAACRGVDTELFYDETDFTTAYTTCMNCPVILDCGAATHSHETEATYFYGVSGGVPPWYRRRWHKARRQQHRALRRAG